MFLILYSCINIICMSVDDNISIDNDIISVDSLNTFTVFVYCEKDGDRARYLKQKYIFDDGKIKHYSTISTYYYKGANAGEIEICTQRDGSWNHIIRTDYSKAKRHTCFSTAIRPSRIGVPSEIEPYGSNYIWKPPFIFVDESGGRNIINNFFVEKENSK